MKINNILSLTFITCGFFLSTAHASGPYTSEIASVQVTELGLSTNTVFLKSDVTDSPCASTNQHNRFTIDTEEKQAVIFVAAAQNKPITIFGTGTCSGSGIEAISAVRFNP